MSTTMQSRLFELIKERLPGHLSLVEAISELLNISNDSAYRRIRGETALNLDEAELLCAHFKISLDNISMAGPESISFRYKPLGSDPSDFENYMTSILADLKKIASFESNQIIFAAKDVPIFHHFHFPGLTRFKLFFWMKSILNVPAFEGKLYQKEEISERYVELCNEIIQTYTQIPVLELWTEETLNSTLKQVEYYWDSGFFQSAEDALEVCDEIAKMVAHVQKQAELGFKFSFGQKQVGREGNFILYDSEVMIGNNNILVTMGNAKVAYITHHTFNSLVTTDPSFCEEIEQWLKNLIRKSVLISGVSEKQRHQFFRKSQENIAALRKRISSFNLSVL